MNSAAGLLTGIGALLAGLAAVVAQFVKIWRRIPEGERSTFADNLKHALRGLLNWATALFLAVAVGGVVILLARTPPQCRPATLSITSPVQGAVVNLSEVATGHVTCLASGQHAWLILQPVVPGGGGYFPQDQVSAAGNTDSWSTTVYFGGRSAVDNGRQFILLAVIADDSADQRFRAWLANGRASGSYPALPDLPGATVLAQVTVTRAGRAS